MRRHIAWIGAGLLMGATLGTVAAARATSCAYGGAGVHLQLRSLTVGGVAQELPPDASEAVFLQAAYDTDADSFLGQHALQVGPDEAPVTYLGMER